MGYCLWEEESDHLHHSCGLILYQSPLRSALITVISFESYCLLQLPLYTQSIYLPCLGATHLHTQAFS